MSKRVWQLVGIFAAIVAYYLIHEGAHLLYLSVLCGFFGGGDMNGITFLCPEWAARCIFGVLLLVNGLVFRKRVLPAYRQSFSER